MEEPKGPRLATVLPVYNEEAHIRGCLESLLHQTVDPSMHMILVLDGGSTDGTLDVVNNVILEHTGKDSPRVDVLDNPGRTVAHARNLALTHLPPSVEWLVEMIGHALVDEHHLQDRLDAWQACTQEVSGRLAGVGVRVVPVDEPKGMVASWIDGAISSPLGQSGGQFASFSKPSSTNVPAFVMHDRSAVESVEGWDTTFLTSQDSDLSMRLLKAGYTLYRHPKPCVQMHKRNTLGQWWKMGHRYGFWRTKVLLRHPRRAKWQEFLPLLGLGLTVGLTSLSHPLWSLPLAAYLGVLAVSGAAQAIKQRRVTSVVGVPVSLVMLHSSFSIGLLDGLVRKGRFPKDRV